jgi:hypothetical protein
VKCLNKIVVYTVIIGDYNHLLPLNYKSEYIDYICFTNNKFIKSDEWDIRYIENIMHLDDTRLNRHYKILAHRYLSEYEYSLYIDGNVKILADIYSILKEYVNKDWKIGMFEHSWGRKCLYEEGLGCIQWGKDSAEKILPQLEKYKDEGIPEQLGLVDANTIFRKHNDEAIVEVMEAWWSELLNHSKRDQISFNYVMYKHKVPYNIMVNNSRGRSDYLLAIPHNNDLFKNAEYYQLINELMTYPSALGKYKNKKIYIFGTARVGEILNLILKGKNFNVKGFLQFNKSLEKYKDGTPILSELPVLKNSVIIVTIEAAHSIEVTQKLNETYGGNNEIISWRKLTHLTIPDGL